jgi:hypothetical protein
MADGTFQLTYDDAGFQARLLDPAGRENASGPVGSVLDVGLVRLTPQPPPEEIRVYELVIHPATQVQGSLGAKPLESTNIVLVAYWGADPMLAPEILNEDTAALQVSLDGIGSETGPNASWISLRHGSTVR